ncbi:MAG: response regulator [Candidatus Omnitrophota bacterium]|jgi:diguanylate cyclase (GGDEF)-like protein|nr:response regulator [Candidatus Omnitrophota bacterium]
MMRPRVLLVDDDPDILDVLEITLSEDNYDISKARDGEEALKVIRSRPFDLIILDHNMPKMTGREVCAEIKKDILLRHIPVLMVTGKGEVHDKVCGLEAGADDYIVKPFEPKELLARIRMTLKRSERDLDANPLTRLPGNISIIGELSERIDKKEKFAVCYVDLNKFKAYNDSYGFEHGDDIIKETARILIRAVQEIGTDSDFIGHIGGDDFVVITKVETAEAISGRIIADFDLSAPHFYNETDRENGYILAKDRAGNMQKVPLVSVSIGIVTNELRKIEHVAQVGEIGAELKAFAKSKEGSNYVKDKRKEE